MKKTRKNLLQLAVVTGLVMAMLSACGSADRSYFDNAAMDVTTESAYSGSTGFAEPAAPYAMPEEAIEIDEEFSLNEGTALSGRKLIKTVNLSVETREYDSFLEMITGKVTALGGYIENMNSYNGSMYSSYSSTRSANLTIRIPKEQLDTLLSDVAEFSNVVNRSEYVEDVTLNYVDIESHRDMLRVEQERLLELLERAESMEDIIIIESRLSEVRYQIESMEKQLRSYDNKVDYSTVYLNVDEVEIFTPIEKEGMWERISNGFVENWKDLGEDIQEIVIWFITSIPYLIIWALVICVIVVILKKWKKRKAAKNSKNAEDEK